MSESLFLSRNIQEVCIIKDGNYSFIADIIFIRNGKKQMWRYTSECDKMKNCKSELKIIH